MLSARSEVSLLTILPGEAVYSEFGHSAFRVRDPRRGIDRIYNYGTFAFDEPFFLAKFIYGRLIYSLSVVPYDYAIDRYRGLGRPVIEQRLRLSQRQRSALFRFLEVNARPENRSYRYDFLFDNCSTRLRDALVTTLGDSLQFGGRPDPGHTFRTLLNRYMADRPGLAAGMNLLLGTPTDRPASSYEVMFLPDYLMRAFDHATVTTASGPAPLVTARDTVFWVDGYDATPRAFAWPRWAAWLLLVAGVLATGWSYYDRPVVPRAADAALFGAAGIVGFVVAFLWFISEHTATNYNWNLAWAWPTHLVAAVVLMRRTVSSRSRRYLAATAVLPFVLLVTGVVRAQPLPSVAWALMLLLAVRAAAWAWPPAVVPPHADAVSPEAEATA
jgi:hypothetical protein